MSPGAERVVRRRKICGRIAFSNPSSNRDEYTPLLKDTVMRNMEIVLHTFPSFTPLLNTYINERWLKKNLLIDYWYLDNEGGRLDTGRIHPTSRSQYVSPNRWVWDVRAVNSDGRSVTSGQTPGKDRIERSEQVPFVLIMTYVSNYIPNTGLHANHLIGAFKENDVLYCFNPWGSLAASLPDSPDNQIWDEMMRKYRCSRRVVYNGPNLQENDQVGACGVLSFTFGTHMYTDAILRYVGQWHPAEPLNDTVVRVFNTYQPAYGPVLTGLQLPHMQNQLTRSCWTAFQVCVDARGRMTVSRSKRRKRSNGQPVPMEIDGNPKRYLVPRGVTRMQVDR